MILYLLKVPPPITGVTLINTYVLNSRLIKNKYQIKSIKVSYARNINNLGVFGLKKIFKIINIFRRLLKEIIQSRPKFIYFQISPLSLGFVRDFLFIIIIKMFSTKIIFHLHGKGIKDASKNIILKYMYHFVFNKNYVICLAHSLITDIRSIHKGPIYVVPNGIPLVNRNILLKNPNRNIPKILYLSHLLVSKGILIFLDTLKILVHNRINFKADIVGSPGDLNEEELKEIVSKNGLKNYINYHGPIYGENKFEILLNSDLLLYPSLNDAFPLVLLEAMQLGVPIISSNEGAIPEIVIDGITGFIVDDNDPDHYCRKTEELINNHELRSRMGEAARKEFSQNYTLEIFEKNMLDVFNKVLHNKKSFDGD